MRGRISEPPLDDPQLEPQPTAEQIEAAVEDMAEQEVDDWIDQELQRRAKLDNGEVKWETDF